MGVFYVSFIHIFMQSILKTMELKVQNFKPQRDGLMHDMGERGETSSLFHESLFHMKKRKMISKIQ